MPTTNPDIPPVPVARLIAALAVASAVGLATVLLSLRVTTGTIADSDLLAALIGAGTVLISGLLAVITLRSVASTGQGNLATACLAFSFVRLFGSLAAAVIIVSMFDPARRPFVNAFLISALLAMTFETLILRKWSALTPTDAAKGVASR